MLGYAKLSSRGKQPRRVQGLDGLRGSYEGLHDGGEGEGALWKEEQARELREP